MSVWRSKDCRQGIDMLLYKDAGMLRRDVEMNKLLITIKKTLACITLIVFSAGLSVSTAHAAGPVTIKWIKTCGMWDWSHSGWVIGLSDGNTLWGYYNPSQGRSATYSMLLTAYMAGKNIYYENATVDTGTRCGVKTTHVLDPNYTNSANIMMSD